jgi:hypothetical protein
MYINIITVWMIYYHGAGLSVFSVVSFVPWFGHIMGSCMTMLSTPLKVTSLKSVMVSKSAVFCSML